MYKEHPVFERPAKENVRIWRYLDSSRFLSLLDKQALFFARADRLADPFEGSYSKANIKLRLTTYKGLRNKASGKGQTTIETMSEVNKNAPKYTYVNCWHINDYESAAMWKLYPTNDEGIAIQSTFKLLTESLNSYLDHNVYIGKVMYIDYETDWLPEGNLFYPFLHKRKSFEHEHELRAVIMKPPTADGGTDYTRAAPELGLYVRVELATLIERVFVSPTAPDWFEELVTSVAGKYNLQKEVKRSSLCEEPVY